MKTSNPSSRRGNSCIDFSFVSNGGSFGNSSKLNRLNTIFERAADAPLGGIREDKLAQILPAAIFETYTEPRLLTVKYGIRPSLLHQRMMETKKEESKRNKSKKSKIRLQRAMSADADWEHTGGGELRVYSRGAFIATFAHESSAFIHTLAANEKVYRQALRKKSAKVRNEQHAVLRQRANSAPNVMDPNQQLDTAVGNDFINQQHEQFAKNKALFEYNFVLESDDNASFSDSSFSGRGRHRRQSSCRAEPTKEIMIEPSHKVEKSLAGTDFLDAVPEMINITSSYSSELSAEPTYFDPYTGNSAFSPTSVMLEGNGGDGSPSKDEIESKWAEMQAEDETNILIERRRTKKRDDTENCFFFKFLENIVKGWIESIKNNDAATRHSATIMDVPKPTQKKKKKKKKKRSRRSRTSSYHESDISVGSVGNRSRTSSFYDSDSSLRSPFRVQRTRAGSYHDSDASRSGSGLRSRSSSYYSVSSDSDGDASPHSGPGLRSRSSSYYSTSDTSVQSKRSLHRRQPSFKA